MSTVPNRRSSAATRTGGTPPVRHQRPSAAEADSVPPPHAAASVAEQRPPGLPDSVVTARWAHLPGSQKAWQYLTEQYSKGRALSEIKSPEVMAYSGLGESRAREMIRNFKRHVASALGGQ